MNRQKSENLGREKLSLRNLLNYEMDSQIKSMNQTVAQRPQTMYTQRQLKMFSEERMKLMSENQMRRGMSSQTARQRLPSAEFTPEQKAKRTKLKHSLGKINLLAEGAIQVQEQDRIRSIYALLECLSRTDNFYKTAFGYIHRSFGEIVYIKTDPFPRDRLEYVAEKTKSEVLIRLYNGINELTYKQLSLSLFESLDKQLIQEEQYHSQVQTNFAELEKKLNEKSNLIKKLTGELLYYENHPSKQQYGYITELEGKVASTELEVRRARAHIKELENSQEYLNQFNNMLSQKVEELRVKLYEFEMQQFAGMREVEKNSELKEFERNVDVLKDLIHKGALRMASMREEYNKIQAYNQELLGERSVLAKRAAVGFAELTPRPNYKKIFEEQGINIHELIPANLRPTTEELVTSLIKCFKQFYSRYMQSSQKLEVEGKSGKGVIGKDPGNLILSEIEKMSKQMKKTENSAEEVKSGYSKQKEELGKKKKK